MEVQANKDKGLHNRWTTLEGDKSTILGLCEKYAAYTLPYMFPVDNTNKSTELTVQVDSIGAQGVNHLANKVVSTLFPSKSLFFRLHMDQEMKDLIAKTLEAAGGGQLDAATLKSELENKVLEAEELLQAAENRAEDHLDMVQYRPQAINAVKLLIITGNALVFHPEDGSPVQVYSLRNYHIVRDCNGQVIEIMTREKKAYETFHPDIQAQLRNTRALNKLYNGNTGNKDYQDSSEVNIYTQILLHDDGKFHVTQYADETRLDMHRTFTAKELRWIPLTWNLINGEDYGRGLVADFAGAFHALGVLTTSLLNLAAIMGDVKFFVDPQSMIDIVELANSLPGSYHSGKAEQIGTPQWGKLSEMQFIQALIERFERQIAQAFMLATQMTRQAERVTAEEIRQTVDELESSNAGIYSRLAATWQQQTANLALLDTHFVGVGDGIDAKVITGMDSLSRAGEAYNMRLFLTDLSLLNSVPEDVRAGIKVPQFIQQMAQYHTVTYESWVMTPTELQAKQDREAQQQLALQQQAGQQQQQVEGIKAATKVAGAS